MRRIKEPTDEALDVFRHCISNICREEFKDRLKSVESIIEVSSMVFRDLAKTAAYQGLEETEGVGDKVSTKEMTVDIYRDKMSKKGQPGRPFYDRLIQSAERGICPLCCQRMVATLDHYLPKARFPALAVAPLNLIPACGECNFIKSQKLDKANRDQLGSTFHPYFDFFPDGRWLYAEIDQGAPPALTFEIRPPDAWEDMHKRRAARHFAIFELGGLYSVYAAEELVNMQYRLSRIFDSCGMLGVQEHLKEEAASRLAANVNSWQSATYEALSNDEWFCRDGFRQIQ